MKKIYVSIALSALVVFAQEEQEQYPPPEEQVYQEEPQEQYPPPEEQVYQEEPQEQYSETVSQEESVPKNTITLDIGPTIIGIGIGIAGNAISDDASASGFGFGLQYERQIFERLSVAGRFAYLGIGAGFTEKEGDDKAKLDANLSSFSIESHIRTYPFGGSFFLDGLLGYANMSANFKGEAFTDAEEDDPYNYGQRRKKKESANIDVSRSYLKSGIKLGWRVDFGQPGGFIFEHGLGYYFGTAFGKTIPRQFTDKMNDEIRKRGENDEIEHSKEMDDGVKILEDFIFIGGPRYTFAFGWRF